jgi:hypothetical protein
MRAGFTIGDLVGVLALLLLLALAPVDWSWLLTLAAAMVVAVLASLAAEAASRIRGKAGCLFDEGLKPCCHGGSSSAWTSWS